MGFYFYIRSGVEIMYLLMIDLFCGHPTWQGYNITMSHNISLRQGKHFTLTYSVFG